VRTRATTCDPAQADRGIVVVHNVFEFHVHRIFPQCCTSTPAIGEARSRTRRTVPVRRSAGVKLRAGGIFIEERPRLRRPLRSAISGRTIDLLLKARAALPLAPSRGQNPLHVSAVRHRLYFGQPRSSSLKDQFDYNRRNGCLSSAKTFASISKNYSKNC
jgi:hypothetical protein